MHDLKLLGHPPKRPFGRNISVVEVVERIGTMKSAAWHTSVYNPIDYKRTFQKHQCRPRKESGSIVIQPGIEGAGNETLANLPKLLSVAVKDQIEGLRLADFTSDNKKK